MTIKLEKTQVTVTEFTDFEAKDIALQYLKERINYTAYTKFEDHAGLIFRFDWQDTGHGSGITDKRRATELEVTVLNLIRLL